MVHCFALLYKADEYFPSSSCESPGNTPDISKNTHTSIQRSAKLYFILHIYYPCTLQQIWPPLVHAATNSSFLEVNYLDALSLKCPRTDISPMYDTDSFKCSRTDISPRYDTGLFKCSRTDVSPRYDTDSFKCSRTDVSPMYDTYSFKCSRTDVSPRYDTISF